MNRNKFGILAGILLFMPFVAPAQESCRDNAVALQVLGSGDKGEVRPPATPPPPVVCGWGAGISLGLRHVAHAAASTNILKKVDRAPETGYRQPASKRRPIQSGMIVGAHMLIEAGNSRCQINKRKSYPTKEGGRNVQKEIYRALPAKIVGGARKRSS